MNPYDRTPSNVITSIAHWEAMADAIGEAETVKLYGTRPERYNSAESVERLYFADKAPRRALWVAVGLAAVMAFTVGYAAFRKPVEVPTVIDPCALVQTRDGSACR
jgi:hypothetical protein